VDDANVVSFRDDGVRGERAHLGFRALRLLLQRAPQPSLDSYNAAMIASPVGYVLRSAMPGDETTIACQRASMFRDMGLISDKEAEELAKASEPWISRLLHDGEYFGWFVLWESNVVAGGGIRLQEMGPVPGCLRVGRWGHIANVYTEPAHRRRGLARFLMDAILEWADLNHVDHLTLSASQDARILYESLGFASTSDMKRDVRDSL